MNESVYEANDLAATDRFGAALAGVLPAGVVIALSGTLGAGKTRLVQAIAAALGVPRDEVVSPTFVLCQQYRGSKIIYHLDAYRLHDEDEMRELGIDELFAAEAIVIVEWADRVAGALPDDHLQIEIEVTGANSRRFAVRSVGTACQPLIAALAAELRA